MALGYQEEKFGLSFCILIFEFCVLNLITLLFPAC